MKTQISCGSIGRTVLSMSLAVIALLFLSGRAGAQVVTLQNDDSSATVDLGSSAGMNNWSVGVNGQMQNQLNQQWFWYSINGGTAASIDTIGGLTYNELTANTLNVTYQNSQLSVNVQYTLSGGSANSGHADLTESISVQNLSGSTFTNLNLYEYSCFNLLGSGNNSINIGTDGQGGYDFVLQNNGSTSLSESITSPSANYAEAGIVPSTLNHVEAGDQLDDMLAASGSDVAWAFEWSQPVANGQEINNFGDVSLSISQVPEPAPIALFALGTLVFGFIRRSCKGGF